MNGNGGNGESCLYEPFKFRRTSHILSMRCFHKSGVAFFISRKLLVGELIFTLSSRVAAVFLSLLIGVPLLLFLCLRCSERCGRWSHYLDKALDYRGRLGLILALLLLAILLSVLLTLQVLDSVEAEAYE